MLLGQADVPGAVEDALDADPALGPGQRAARAGVGTPPEGDVGLGVGAVGPELGGALELPRVAVGRAVEQHDRGAGGDLDTADRRRAAGQAEVGLHRALDPQHLLEEVGDPVAVGPELVLQLGVLGQVLERGREQPGGRLLAGGEQERRGPHHRGDLRRRAVGVGGQRQVGEHVLAGLAPPVLDVLGEPLVEPGQRVLPRAALLAGADLARRCRLSPKPSRKRWWSSSGTPSRSATTSMAKGWV